MTSPSHLELLKVASDRVLTKTGTPLSDVQERILEQVLAGKKLMQIQVCGYAETTVQRDFCPKLWRLLSEATGRQVRFSTIRLVLEKELKESQPQIPLHQDALPDVSAPCKISHNLPAPSCTSFIGREDELVRLLELLSPRHAAHIISVDGIGGVGKTTLVLEAAYRCLRSGDQRSIARSSQSSKEVPKFDIIIFTSAKEFLLTPFGFLKSLSPRRTLNDIFRQIARVVDDLDLTGISFNDQLDLITDTLAQYRTLLIVDNLETVKDQQDVLAFLYELPPTVKAVITTREQIIFVPVRLTSMPEGDGVSLIEHEAQVKGVVLSEGDRLQLYQATGGIPVAISYAIGQLANGYPIREVLQKIAQPTGDVARFCFESSVQLLQGNASHQLLMVLALFPAPAHQEALVQVACPEAEAIQADLARLRGLSLVRQEQDRYTMLLLTREFALAELNAHPEFAQEARSRWVNWYLEFSKIYAEQDAKEWDGGSLDELEGEWQNLQAVMDWCMTQNYYQECLSLWQNLKTYTQLRGRHISRLGCWSDRLNWLSWLIQAAEQRGDWEVATQMMLDKAWTLTSIGKPVSLEEAEILLRRSWELRHHQTPLFQINLAKNLAILSIQQQRLTDAETWLQQAQALLDSADVAEPERSRQIMQIQYYQGEILFKAGDYQQAKQVFEAALAQAQELNLVRAIFMIQNWLADIAIDQGEFEAAHTLLTEGLRVAEVNQDRTRLAYCQQSLAKLAQQQGHKGAIGQWATAALENFEALGMVPEAEDVRALLGQQS